MGVFHEMACGHCHGSGLVDKETGEPLDPEALIVQLALRWRTERKESARLRNELAEKKSAVYREDRGHGPMGRRYHGD